MHQIVDYATHRKTFAPTKRKYQYLLEDADVRRWHENVSRGSAVTADVYLRRLGSFCQSHDTSPKALIAFNEIELYNLLLDLISSMEKEGHAGSYTESVFKAIRSWLSHNGKDIRRKIKIRGTGDAPSLRDERVPTKESPHTNCNSLVLSISFSSSSYAKPNHVARRWRYNCHNIPRGSSPLRHNYAQRYNSCAHSPHPPSIHTIHLRPSELKLARDQKPNPDMGFYRKRESNNPHRISTAQEREWNTKLRNDLSNKPSNKLLIANILHYSS